jgi:predicted N-acetyltransferase YhbS
MIKVAIQPIQEEEIPSALDVLGKAFATMPNPLAIFSGKSDIERRMKIALAAMLEHLPGQVFVAEQSNQIVGAMRIVKWPDCQLSPLQGEKMMPAMMKIGGEDTVQRMFELRGTWAKSDPKKPHWHLDPLGVTPELQGQGIGSQMMEYYCKHVDELGMAAYHETDTPQNVKFYERFGFKFVGEELINGIPNWYLWRPPSGEA